MRGASVSCPTRSLLWGCGSYVLTLTLVSVVLLVAWSGSVAGADTTAPEWGTATKANDTTIEVTLYDETELADGTITANDFVLSRGQIASVSVTPITDSGRSGARVALVLDHRQNVDEITVGLRNGAIIADMAGNHLPEETVTVTGMDTVTPRYRDYGLSRVNASTVEIRAVTNEPLDGLRVEISGAADATLSRENFTETVDGEVTYTARYSAPVEGSYDILWSRATDRYNNTIGLARLERFRYDTTPPTVRLEGPTNTTVGTPVNFTARNSTDDQLLDSFQWRLDGGTLLTGESIRIAFATRGTHDVTVEVTDRYGNAAVATRTVTVTRPTGSVDGVTITQPNTTYAAATVEGSGLTQQLRSRGTPLVASGPVSLVWLSGTFPANERTQLTLRARNETAAGNTNGTTLGLFELDHDAVTVDDVRFRFAVDRDALTQSGTQPEGVTLYRDDGGWQPLDTTVLSRSDQRVLYRASSPGLSRFAVSANGTDTIPQRNDNTSTEPPQSTPAPTPNRPVEPTETPNRSVELTETQTPSGSPNVSVTNVTVEPASPTVGEQATITVTLRNRGTVAGQYRVTIFLGNSSLASRQVTVPAGQRRTATFTQNLSSAGELTVSGRQITTIDRAGGSGVLSSLPAPLGEILSVLPNPLALWPDGLVGTVLGAAIGLVVTVYAVLKALAIYLGY